MARARATTSRAVVHAAARVFEAKGYGNTTVDDIAEAADISRPTFYSYAKSKRLLFDQIVDELLDDLAERLEQTRTLTDAHERLRAVIDTHIDAAVTNRTFLAVLLSAEADLTPRARRRFRTWARSVTEDFRELLVECLDRDRLAEGLDPTVAANLVVTMLVSVHRWYDPRASVGQDELADQILMLISGVLGPATPCSAARAEP